MSVKMDNSNQVRTVTEKLNELTKLTSKDRQIPLVRVFFSLIELGGQEVEKANSLLDFERILKGSSKHKERSIPIIQYILELIGVENSDLLGCKREELEACRRDFAYASVIVKMCIDLYVEDFDSLKQIVCRDILEVHHDNVKSSGQLFLMLHQKAEISPDADKRTFLKKKLQQIGRTDLVNQYVDHFVTTGEFKIVSQTLIAQETNQPVPPADVSAKVTVMAKKVPVQSGQTGRFVTTGELVRSGPTLVSQTWFDEPTQETNGPVSETSVMGSIYSGASQPTGSDTGAPHTLEQRVLTSADNNKTASCDEWDKNRPLGFRPSDEHQRFPIIFDGQNPAPVQQSTRQQQAPSLTLKVEGQTNTTHNVQGQPSTTSSQQPAYSAQSSTTSTSSSEPAVSASTPLLSRQAQEMRSFDASAAVPPPSDRDTTGSLGEGLHSTSTQTSGQSGTAQPKGITEQIVISQQSTTCGNKCCLVCLIFFSILTTLILPVFITFSVYGGQHPITSKSSYAVGGDTIVLAEVTDPWNLTSMTISECPTSADFPHMNSLYIVPGTDLQHREFSYTSNTTSNIPRIEPDCGTNLIFNRNHRPLYLLINSTILFDVCLMSLDQSGSHGTLLIYDSNEALEEQTSDENCPSVMKAVYQHNLNIGQQNYECINGISYQAKSNGYHYLIVRTPANTELSYNFSYKQLYLDPNDLSNLACTFSSAGDSKCDRSGLEQSPSYLIVSVGQNTELNSISTHICLAVCWDQTLIDLVACFGVALLISFSLSFVCVCVLCCRSRVCGKSSYT